MAVNRDRFEWACKKINIKNIKSTVDHKVSPSADVLRMLETLMNANIDHCDAGTIGGWLDRFRQYGWIGISWL